MKSKLTKKIIEALVPRDVRYEVMCDALPGFGVRVLPGEGGSNKIFFVRYRVGGGRRGSARWMRLGPPSEHYTLERARRDAQRVLQEAREGRDPANDRATQREAPAMTELCTRYMAEYAVAPNKAASSIRMDELNIRLHVLPNLGKLKVADVRREHIRQLKVALADKPGAANRVVGLLSCMFNLAEEWGLRPEHSNPCRGLKRYKERKRERFLTAAERQRLEQVLRAAAGKQRRQRGYICQGAVDGIRLLSMSGARLSEILDLEWSMVELDNGWLRLPSSKEDQAAGKILTLSEQAIDYLREIEGRRTVSAFVCPNEEGKRHANFQSIWRRIRDAAELEDVHLHALRHSFISDAVRAGVPLFVAGKMAGHRSVQTTQRYAHLEDETLRQGLRMVGRAIAERTDPTR